MARQKMYVIMAGVMRAKWIDAKDVYDKPDVVFSLPISPADEIVKPIKEENQKILMVADEPGGLRHPVDKATGKRLDLQAEAKVEQKATDVVPKKKPSRPAKGGKR